MGLAKKFGDVISSLTGRQFVDNGESDPYRCIKCGGGFDRGYETCPECGGRFVVSTEEQ